jgi:small subunit ribosomal protein S17
MPRRTIVGTVTSNKMQKTLVISTERKYMESRTGKIVGTRKKYKVHCEDDSIKAGDMVEAIESRSYSKDKNFRLHKVLKRVTEVGQIKEDA